MDSAIASFWTRSRVWVIKLLVLALFNLISSMTAWLISASVHTENRKSGHCPVSFLQIPSVACSHQYTLVHGESSSCPYTSAMTRVPRCPSRAHELAILQACLACFIRSVLDKHDKVDLTTERHTAVCVEKNQFNVGCYLSIL
jgi:hypothetical protein